jgi:DNA-binding GntR family transcriptional regulator
MQTLAANVLQTLADEIISGKLPPGSKLEEKALIARFDVSRTPVREALRGLSERKLISLVRRQGGVVSDISIDQLADMLEAECELEALCARLAALRMRAVDKGRLQTLHKLAEQHVKRHDHGRFLELNKQFHDLICEGSGSETMAQIVRGLGDRLGPFRRSQGNIEDRLAVSHDEHDSVVAAILRSDAEGAYEAMHSHTARLGSNVLELMRASRENRPSRRRSPALRASPRRG